MLIVFSGPSGCGKTTLVHKLAEGDGHLHISRSYTTRPRKPGEVAGVDYNFTTREIFMQMADEGKFVEWAEVHGNLYGTPVPEPALVAKGDLVLEIDCQGAEQIRQMFPLAKSIFVYVPLPELEARLKERKRDTAEEMATRLMNAKREFAEMYKFDAWIENVTGNLPQTTAELSGLITLWRHNLATPSCYREPHLLYHEVPQ